jgi:hypothetical protein
MENGQLHRVLDKKEAIQHIYQEEELVEKDEDQGNIPIATLKIKDKTKKVATLFTKEEDEEIVVDKNTFY